jgi:hypothetical protein
MRIISIYFGHQQDGDELQNDLQEQSSCHSEMLVFLIELTTQKNQHTCTVSMFNNKPNFLIFEAIWPIPTAQ